MRHFSREGRELEYSRNGTSACRIDGIASRPCKERKDGAPTVVLLQWKPKPTGARRPPQAGIIHHLAMAVLVMVYSVYPQRLKPGPVVTPDGTAEAMPFHETRLCGENSLMRSC